MSSHNTSRPHNHILSLRQREALGDYVWGNFLPKLLLLVFSFCFLRKRLPSVKYFVTYKIFWVLLQMQQHWLNTSCYIKKSANTKKLIDSSIQCYACQNRFTSVKVIVCILNEHQKILPVQSNIKRNKRAAWGLLVSILELIAF